MNTPYQNPQYKSIPYPLIKTYLEAEAKIERIPKFYHFSPAKAHRYAKAILRAESIDEARRIFSKQDLSEVIESLEEAEADVF